MKTATVHIVGLKDGFYTAGTAFLLRQIRALGATVKLTKTGRVTVRDAAGKVTVYTVKAPQSRAEAEALLANNPTPESPLSRAYADLTR
jgi:tRNA U38,U39,U40 pseudouridine synthase TruA